MSKYVLTTRANFSGVAVGINDINNVFAYEDIPSDGNAVDLGESFQANVLPDILAVTSNGVIYNQIEVINLDDPADWSLTTFSSVGLRAGDMLPGFAAWQYEYVRAVRIPNNGRKAFAGVAEGDQAGGSATGTIVPLLATLATTLLADVVGAGSTYITRIWRRAGDYGDPPVAFPDTFYDVSAVVYRRISTQNSRKR